MCWKVPHELRSHALLGSGPRARHRRPLGRTAVAAQAERRAEPHCTPAGGEREVRRKVPACAGPTRSRSRQASTFAEDPRVRGADATGSSFSRSRLEGSPRARGRPVCAVPSVPDERRIPAGAGSTPDRLPPSARGSEDPRACGGDATQVGRGDAGSGGSPRVGGATRSCRSRPSRTTEDPRARGANGLSWFPSVRRRGGSPRARGRRARAPRPRAGPRRIPACAGTTARPWRRWSGWPEDPRVRGDDASASAARLARAGGSPRARGRPPTSASGHRTIRRIPACAGTTAPVRRGAATAREDPRVRGDDSPYGRSLVKRGGGSPRTRGRQGPGAQSPALRRGIPAHAGSTLAELRSYRPVCEFSFSCFPVGHRDRDQDSRPTLTPVRAP